MARTAALEHTTEPASLDGCSVFAPAYSGDMGRPRRDSAQISANLWLSDLQTFSKDAGPIRLGAKSDKCTLFHREGRSYGKTDFS